MGLEAIFPEKRVPRNYFDSESVAELYARARPAFHPHVMERLRVHLRSRLPFRRALDVACGTGGSTSSLQDLASRVVGIDPSLPMLRRAVHDAREGYVASSAEDLPFADATFDLLTVSSAFHWFDRGRFLKEAGRVLCVDGILVVYDNYFAGTATETDQLAEWVFGVYRVRYPAPPRATVEFETSVVEDGLLCIHREEYSNYVTFSQRDLVEYLLSQTNMIAAIEQGATMMQLRDWLRNELRSRFANDLLTIHFCGPIWILRRI